MSLHPFLMYDLARLKHDEFLQEAQRERLASSAGRKPELSLHPRSLVAAALDSARRARARLLPSAGPSAARLNGRSLPNSPA